MNEKVFIVLKLLKVLTIPIRRLLIIPLFVIGIICWGLYGILGGIVWLLTSWSVFDKLGDPDDFIGENFSDFGEWMIS